VSRPARPSHGDWDSVLETSQLYEAELAALKLREAGLDARVIDQSYRQEPVPSVRSFAVVRVLVPSERALDARRLLAESSPLPPDAETGDAEERGDAESGDEK
jgi:hypothetical protein